MTEREDSELRPAYRTLDDPTRLLGFPLAGWVTLVVAGAVGDAWLLVSPLWWRAHASPVVSALGAPAGLLVVREQSTVSVGRLLLAVVRWRARSPLITALQDGQPVRRGAVRLDRDTVEPAPSAPALDAPAILGSEGGR